MPTHSDAASPSENPAGHRRYRQLGGARFNVGGRRLTATWPYIKLQIDDDGIYVGPVDFLRPVLFYIQPVLLPWPQVAHLKYANGTLFVKDRDGTEHNFGSWNNDAWPAVVALLGRGKAVSFEQQAPDPGPIA